MKRNTIWSYKAFFGKGNDRVIQQISKHIEYYDRYNSLRREVSEDFQAPQYLKVNMKPIKMPKYLKWLKKYLIEEI